MTLSSRLIAKPSPGRQLSPPGFADRQPGVGQRFGEFGRGHEALPVVRAARDLAGEDFGAGDEHGPGDGGAVGGGEDGEAARRHHGGERGEKGVAVGDMLDDFEAGDEIEAGAGGGEGFDRDGAIVDGEAGARGVGAGGGDVFRRRIDAGGGKAHARERFGLEPGAAADIERDRPAKGRRGGRSRRKCAAAMSRMKAERTGVIRCSIAELPLGFHQSSASLPKNSASPARNAGGCGRGHAGRHLGSSSGHQTPGLLAKGGLHSYQTRVVQQGAGAPQRVAVHADWGFRRTMARIVMKFGGTSVAGSSASATSRRG